MSELFPSFVDLGKNRSVEKSYEKQLAIESTCPVNFEYEIKVLKDHPDIHVSPLTGDIFALQTTSIKIEYTPKSYTTAECEIQIRTTEFDSEPKLIRIVGSAAPGKEVKAVRVRELSEAGEEKEQD